MVPSFKLKLVAMIAAITLMFTFSAPSLANTPPNVYEPVGESWIEVAESDKIYLENFNQNHDDNALYYVGSGIECTSLGVTAQGPFISPVELDEQNCNDSSATPFDPVDNLSRLGSIPFGFTINFFGQEYSDAWPNTNGGIFFQDPDNEYDLSMPQLAYESESSVMFALGADLHYSKEDSNFWTAQTVVDGKDAVVFSWEDFHNCCTDGVDEEDMSFQIVLINLGDGDFDAYFNYDSFSLFDQGYTAESIYIDLETGVSPQSNIFTTDDAIFASTTCTQGGYDDDYPVAYGDVTDADLVTDLENGFFYKKESDTSISIWADGGCETGEIESNVLQDKDASGHAFIEFFNDDDNYESIAVGWAIWNPESSALDWTELLRNVDAEELLNGALEPLIERSLNTEVVGRFVIGQRGGVTVTDSASFAPTATLAKTGANFEWLFFVGLICLISGAGILTVSRRKRTA
jgi:LPXTG-motif cell wall-anchored protein